MKIITLMCCRLRWTVDKIARNLLRKEYCVKAKENWQKRYLMDLLRSSYLREDKGMEKGSRKEDSVLSSSVIRCPCYFSNSILTQFCKIYRWDRRHHTPERNKNSFSYCCSLSPFLPVSLSSASQSIATNKAIISRYRCRSCFFHFNTFVKSFTPSHHVFPQI